MDEKGKEWVSTASEEQLSLEMVIVLCYCYVG
jgi:hypothetical protein